MLKQTFFHKQIVEDVDDIFDLQCKEDLDKKPNGYYVKVFFKREGDNKGKEILLKAHLGKAFVEEISRSKTGSITYKHPNNEESTEYYTEIELDAQGATFKNIMKMVEIDLYKDFEPRKYILCEKSELVARQIRDILEPPEYVKREKSNKQAIDEEKKDEDHDLDEALQALAQKDGDCKRAYNETIPEGISNYQLDGERIVSSKAFRRMVDKSQVYSPSKGDHYRTRMTHSLVVNQIAKNIATRLKLNVDLTEAIALGHDIGHTPFGHQGERTINDILKGKWDIIKNHGELMSYKAGEERDNPFGGFKHNYQSIRIATMLEDVLPGIPGMNLSYQTLEGMVKHTGLKRNKNSFDWDAFLDEEDIDEVAREAKAVGDEFPTTLEGQVVAVADEIAQRCHDLDDAFMAGVITPGLLEENVQVGMMADYRKRVIKIVEDVFEDGEKEGHLIRDKGELETARIIEETQRYFMEDVISESGERIKEYYRKQFDQKEFEKDHRVNKNLIDFSSQGTRTSEYIETIINNKVINNPEVALNDSNGETIVKGLFKAYYNNPRLLPRESQRRLYLDIIRTGKKNESSYQIVDFETGNNDVVRDEFERMSTEDLFEKDDKEKQDFSAEQKEYMEKRILLVRTICDYISGMTDTYAANEYIKIIKPL